MAAVGVDPALLISPFTMYRYDASYAIEARARHPGRFGLIKPVDPSDPGVVGTAAVHWFLDRVFRIAADPVDEPHGEVDQYVGDAMVVTWTARSTAPARSRTAGRRPGFGDAGLLPCPMRKDERPR
jgi:hypothetical protein